MEKLFEQYQRGLMTYEELLLEAYMVMERSLEDELNKFRTLLWSS